MKDEPSAAGGAVSSSVSPPSVASPGGQVRYAGFRVRLIAFILDYTLIPIVYVLLIQGYTLLFGDSRLAANYMADESPYDWFVTLLPYTFMALFIVLFWIFCHGATPGKMALGICIRDAHTQNEAPWYRLCLRLIGYVLSAVPLLGGFMLMLFEPRRRALHDLISGTVVVYRDPR